LVSSSGFSHYDYRPAREVADAAEGTAVRSVIDVDNRLWPSNALPLRTVECALQLPSHPRSAKYNRARQKPNSYQSEASPQLRLVFVDAYRFSVEGDLLAA